MSLTAGTICPYNHSMNSNHPRTDLKDLLLAPVEAIPGLLFLLACGGLPYLLSLVVGGSA